MVAVTRTTSHGWQTSSEERERGGGTAAAKAGRRGVASGGEWREGWVGGSRREGEGGPEGGLEG